MPVSPAPNDIHLDIPLTSFALKYESLEYLAYQISPAVQVLHESDKYYIFNAAREQLNVPNPLRAIGDKSAEIRFAVTNDSYTCEEYSLHYPLADRIRDNADNPMRLRERGTQQVIDQLNLAKEVRLQAMYQTTGGSVPSGGVTTKWDAANATPESDIQAAKSAVRSAIGREPNSILMSIPVADALVIHLKSILTALDLGTKLSFINLPDILWGLKVYLAKGIKNTANAAQTPVIADIWNDNVVVFYQDPSPAIDVMSFVYTMQALPSATKTWREEARKSEMIEVSVIEVEKMVAPTAAHIIEDVLT